MPGSLRHLRLRRALAYLSVALLAATLGFAIYKASTTSLAEGLEDIPYNELTNESIKGREEFSRSLFQLGILLTAGLWGSVISKKDEAAIVLSETPEMIMFLSASALLISSLVDHSIYLHYVSRIFALAGHAFAKDDPSMPNVFDPSINNFYVFQIVHLVLGCAVAVTTLLSAHVLKEEP